MKSIAKKHHYSTTIQWEGNTGEGTKSYGSYERAFSVKIDGKVDIDGSSDPAFRGDARKHNPEELFLSSIASCHMLWYLHLCADASVVVLQYEDEAFGVMEESANGGKFIEIVLRPKVIVAQEQMIEKATELHRIANEKCFIANSLNIPVKHQPIISVEKQF